MKKVVLSVFPNKFVWLVGVDVEFVLPCRSDPLGRYGDESEREEDLLNYYETFVTNASAESLNSGIKGFRAELHGISNLPFFFYRVCKIY